MPVASRFTGRLDADANGVLHSMEILKTPRMITDVTFASEMEEACISSSGSEPLITEEFLWGIRTTKPVEKLIDISDHCCGISIKHHSREKPISIDFRRRNG